MRRELLLAFLFVSLLAGSASADLTGTWSGTYTATATACNPPKSTSGNISASLMQSGNSVTGSVVVELNLVDCEPVSPAIPVGLPISGSVSGNSFTFQFVIDISGGPVGGTASGTVSGTTMTISFSSGDSSGTATLTQTSTSPPGSALSGMYSGTFNDVLVPCEGKLPPVAYSGGISGSLTQSGTTLSGVLTTTGLKDDVWSLPDKSDCRVVDDPDASALLTGQISGAIISGVVIEEEDVEPFIGSISGTTISVQVLDQEPGESFTFTISRTSSAVGPAIVRFDADPASISAGQSSKLSWSTLNATVSIDNGIGAQPAVGSITVKPTATTSYTLTASGAGTSVTAKATVTVSGAGGPQVAISSFPKGMVQAAGEGGGTDSFAVTNVGTAATDLTLSPSGNFFSVSPTSFNLPAGGTQTISVTGNAQAAGFFEGSVGVSGNGASGVSVSIRLLSAARPSGTVTAAPTVARSDVSAPAGQNPSGSVSFTNSSSSVLTGIAVSDVPWITPQSGVITIQPGQTQAITFTIDSSKRPDASSPLGGVTGKISLVFISGATSGKNALATTPTSSVSVTIVYVVAPGVTSGSPPPLNAGELVLFVPGLQNRPKAVGDLLIANRQTNAPLTDLKLYFQGATAPSQVASLPQIGANAAVSLPGLAKNIFGTLAPSGTAQIRGGDLSKVAVGAVQFNNSSSSGTFGTAVPVFRSDRGIISGGQMVISGVLKDSGTQTDLYVQELTGNAATVQIDFLNAAGSVISSRPQDPLQGFAFLEMVDAVPANAVAVRIKNTSSGAAKINAYGMVINPSSGDRWMVNDPAVNANTDSIFIFPVVSAGSGAQTPFFVTNRTGAAASVTIDTRSAAGRRRPIASHSVDTLAETTQNLAPLETLSSSAGSSINYVRVLSSTGAISVNARSVRTAGANTFGSGLPALPASGGVAAGELKRFAGVEDASSISRSTATPGTFRTNLILIEASNQPATVRLTLRYTFVAGATVSATAVSSKEYSIGAAQYLAINDLARDVIGNQRDSFGDLHNMELDVEVTGGSGRVLPFLQSIDNGSGDTVIRTE